MEILAVYWLWPKMEIHLGRRVQTPTNLLNWSTQEFGYLFTSAKSFLYGIRLQKGIFNCKQIHFSLRGWTLIYSGRVKVGFSPQWAVLNSGSFGLAISLQLLHTICDRNCILISMMYKQQKYGNCLLLCWTVMSFPYFLLCSLHQLPSNLKSSYPPSIYQGETPTCSTSRPPTCPFNFKLLPINPLSLFLTSQKSLVLSPKHPKRFFFLTDS